MLLAKPMNLMHLTGDYFGGVLERDCTKRWSHTLPEITEVPRNKEVDISVPDEEILDTANSVEELLILFLSMLHDRLCLQKSNRHIDQLMKRYILAVIAVSCIDEERLDGTLSLNLQLTTIQSDGIGELLETVDDIRDFYSCVNDPTSATPTVETFTVELKRS